MSSTPLKPVSLAEVTVTRLRLSYEEIAAWVILGGFLAFVMFRHLVPGVVGGLALFLILDRLSMWFAKRMPRTAARPLALILVSIISVAIFATVIGFSVVSLRL